MKGLVPLRAEEETTRPPLSPRAPSRKATRGQSEKVAVYKPRSRSSPDTESAGSLILDFLASRTERINVVYTTSSVLFCYGSQS